jgi:VPDSG-CTERM motif
VKLKAIKCHCSLAKLCSPNVVDFWVAANILGAQGTLNVVFGSTVFSYVFPASSGYTEHTFTVTASSSTTALQFIFLELGPQNLLLLDDVSVTPASVPDAGSTLPLLGFASVGLVALRRKLGC